MRNNGKGKKVVGPLKLKLWTFFWGQGEHNEPIVSLIIMLYHNM